MWPGCLTLVKKKIATHSWGAGVAELQNIHAAFAAPNTTILEIPPLAGPLHRELWGDILLHEGWRCAASAAGAGWTAE